MARHASGVDRALASRVLRDAVELIAYADRLGGDLPGLRRLLEGPLAGLFGGVHVLPFYDPIDGADAGFDPDDHLAVDPRLGTWEDVRALASGRDLVADAIVNHVSVRSAPFAHWLARGEASPAAGMFLTYEAVFPEGATEPELLAIYRPRPGLPFTPFTLADRTRRLVWTTFTSAQADLDVAHPAARAYLTGVLERLAGAGVRLVRLDAVGYAVKRGGPSRFLTPATLAFVRELTAEARGLGMEVLVEAHTHFSRQREIAGDVDWVYDFALPPLVLRALQTGDGRPLGRWLSLRPANCVTVLDTHDGIGIIDVGADTVEPELAGLLGEADLDALVEGIHKASGGASRRATGAAASNVDLYQVNCTFYDAMGRDDAGYLLARALQLFVPGLPQVYYVGLLAGENDSERLSRTGVGREINRHAYTEAEVLEALVRPVVRAQTRLIGLRSSHPAFGGEFTWGAPAPERLVLAWRAREEEAVLEADLAQGQGVVRWTEGGRRRASALTALG